MENPSVEFREFPKIPRLFRTCVITEKIDGTNAQITITEDGDFLTGSRSRWITPDNDNMGFSRWAYDHEEELLKLGVGTHYGEWWGQKIQRGYDLKEKRFSLFNTSRWSDAGYDDENGVHHTRPSCCHVVPVLYEGMFSTGVVEAVKMGLSVVGSSAALGYMRPEGVVIYHVQGNLYFKSTIEKDEQPKGIANA